MPEKTTSVVGGGRVPPVCVFVCVQLPLFSFLKFIFMGCKSPAAPVGRVERLISRGRMGRKEGNGGERVIHTCLHLRKPTAGGLTYSTCCVGRSLQHFQTVTASCHVLFHSLCLSVCLSVFTE